MIAERERGAVDALRAMAMASEGVRDRSAAVHGFETKIGEVLLTEINRNINFLKTVADAIEAGRTVDSLVQHAEVWGHEAAERLMS